MIRFVGEGPDALRIIGIGLSRGNCEKLLAGQPLKPIHLQKDMNLPYRAAILILGGETEEAIAAELRAQGMLDGETTVHEVPSNRQEHGQSTPAPSSLTPPSAEELMATWRGVEEFVEPTFQKAIFAVAEEVLQVARKSFDAAVAGQHIAERLDAKGFRVFAFEAPFASGIEIGMRLQARRQRKVGGAS